MSVVCPNCGQETPEGFPRCANCGAELGAEPAAAREERKVVTVLFCDLVGFTGQAESMDPEDVRALLSGYHERVRRELERHGGRVEKFVGDAVMALFGAPVAHEDDPERAVRAALAIREWAGEQAELRVRVGITTGEALVTLGARPEAGEGMASGDVVNTASRLQAAAPENAIIVDEATFRATDRDVDYRELEPIGAKGKAHPVGVWEALEARARLGADAAQEPAAPLIGRESERSLLLDALGRARSTREPQLVTIVGVPGIGKSRLVYELLCATDADPELITWRQGRCLPYGEEVTFRAVAEMVKAEAGVLDSDAAREAAEKLHRSVEALVGSADEAAWVERHLGPLLGLGGEERATGDRRTEAFAGWRRYFESLAELRPLVLVFEDLHWADDDLLDFVDHLVDWSSGVPLLCVCTTRPELHDRRSGWGGGKANAATISLAALADNEIARLVAALVERPILPGSRQALLFERAGGNPLYAEQYARVLAEGGELDEQSLPETIQGMIAARLDGLAADEKELLQDAAVLGKVFWMGALLHLDGAGPWELEERLHALESKQFVRRERRPSIAGEREYAFHHLLLREVAYSQIPRVSRAEKHRRVAEWLETLAPDRSEDRAEMLAHHYLATLEFSRLAGLDVSPLVEPARAALAEAGDRALALSALEPARRFYAEALRLPSADEHGRAHLLLRQARSLAGVIDDEGQAGLRNAIPAFLASGEVEAAAEAEAALANGLWVRGQRAAADEHAARAAELIAGAPPSPTTLSVLAERARLLLVAGAGHEAEAVAREGLVAADALGRDDFRAQLLVTIGACRGLRGDFGGIEDLEEGLAIAKARNMAATIQRAYSNLAEVNRRTGDGKKAIAMLAAGRESNERYGHRSGLLWTEGDEAFDFYLSGAWDESLERCRTILATAEAGSGHYHEPMCRGLIAMIAIARGDVQRALAESLRAVELVRHLKDPQVVSPVLVVRASILVETEDPEAERVVDESLAVGLEYTASIALALVLSELGRADEILPMLENLGAPPWTEAALLIVRGAFAEAADRLAQMACFADEAYARLRAAERLVAQGRRADADVQLQQALGFYRSVGATRYVREGEALLARSA